MRILSLRQKKNNLSQTRNSNSVSFTLKPIIFAFATFLSFSSFNQYLLRIYDVLGCALSVGAIVIDKMEAIFAVLLPTFSTTWCELSLDNPPQLTRFPNSLSLESSLLSSSLIPPLAGFLTNVFLYIVHEMFLSERFQDDRCTWGVMKTNTTDDGWPCIRMVAVSLKHFYFLCLFCQKQFRREAGESAWVRGQMRRGCIPQIRLDWRWCGWVTTQSQAAAGKRPSFCSDVVL